MTRIHRELTRTLWRGQNPYISASSGPPDLQGWGSGHRYLSETIDQLRPSIIVEIGVWKGASVIHMASHLRALGIDGAVIAVDTWLGAWDHWINDDWFRQLASADPERRLYSIFLKNVIDSALEDYVVPLPLDSINASYVIKNFGIVPDIIHIDAGHDYDSVTADLSRWWPILRPGGMLIGDDYREGNDWPEVKRAFDDFLRPKGLLPVENTEDKCRLLKPPEAPDSGPSPAFGEAASAVEDWREARRIEFSTLAEQGVSDPAGLLERYTGFVGPKWPGIRRSIVDNIIASLNIAGIACAKSDVFGEDDEIRLPEPLPAGFPAISARYFTPATTAEFSEEVLLAPSRNPLSHLALPAPLDKQMGLPQRPALKLYSGRGQSLFVSPLGYQLFDAERAVYWPAASTGAYSSKILSLPKIRMRHPLVIVQDVFEGTNFSHFLFDWIPRTAHFLASRKSRLADFRFLMGGAPSKFHDVVLQALCDMHGLSKSQFLFPQRPEIWLLDGPLFFFSDLRAEIMHPAHIAHERSVDVIRAVGARIRTSARDLKRIYISRGDTPLRRVVNELALFERLAPLGFRMVQFAPIPVLSQIEIVRGADVIVAPHGMGLTHLALHAGKPAIVELHNPTIGTDAYACLSHALGFTYRSVIGSDIDNAAHDYHVSPGTVLEALAELGVATPLADGRRDEFVTTMYPGVQARPASVTSEVPAASPAHPVLKHVFSPPPGSDDNNVGWLEVSQIPEGVVCFGSCAVWIPSSFGGSSVTLHAEEFFRPARQTADMGLRDQWQRLTVHGVATKEPVNFVLRCEAQAGDVCYSTNWQCRAHDIGE